MVSINPIKHPLLELIKMVSNGTYYCKYPENLDVNLIRTSSEWKVLDLFSSDKKLKIPRHGDVIKEFIVTDVTGDLEVSIFFRGKVFWSKKVSTDKEPKDIHFSLMYGLPVICVPEAYGDNSVFWIQVKGDYTYIGALYLFLDADDRKFLANSSTETLHTLASEYGTIMKEDSKKQEMKFKPWYKFW